uniref:exosome complex component MTR3-like n=1 Tax=Styela clava TaxID=7725 RepID=UPI00193A880C|nr:exosome complex component MTR3-like [Styela clava]
MPTDSRRIPAPENSFSPDIYISDSKKTTQLLDNGRRFDGRSSDEVRPLFLKTGVISQARGSSYIEMKNTKVICAVYGPRDIGRRDDFQMEGVLKCEFKFAPFSCKQRRGHIRDNQEMEYSQILAQALEPAVLMHKFPKAQVDVYVTVLENDGGSLAAGIMAASLALTDASIEMYDMVTSYNVRLSGKNMLIHDPTALEEFDSNTSDGTLCINQGNVTVALLPLLNQVSGMVSTGIIDCDMLSDAIQKCTDGAQSIYSVMQKAVIESYNENDVTDGEET